MKLIRNLTWTAAVCYFHFTARHLAGIKNKIADSLSHFIITAVSSVGSRGRQGPSDLTGATTVNLGLNDLNLTVSSLWNSALSSRTLSAHETGLQSFKTFLIMINLVSTMESLPVVSEDIVMLYIAHCYKTLKLSYTTIQLYLCGIRFAYLKAGIPYP